MGERKVMNKYYPSDYDRRIIPRPSTSKNRQKKVRTMLPMSTRCRACGNYIGEGTKFNSREEVVTGEKYLGIKMFRFYSRCKNCSSEFTFKTDPQNSDYVIEYGASRNYEPWRAKDEVLDQAKRKRNAQEMGDTMKSLENRALDSKREMDINATLDEVKFMKSRSAKVSEDAMLKALQREKDDEEKKLKEVDEALTKSAFLETKTCIIKRINDEDIDSDEEDFAFVLPGDKRTLGYSLKKRKIDSLQSRDNVVVQCANSSTGKGKHVFKLPSVEVSVVKKAAAGYNSKGNKQASKSREENMSFGLQSLCKQYSSDEEDNK